MAKRRRIPKGAKGLAIPKGGCRVVEGKVRICVSKGGVVSMAAAGGAGRKRKAGRRRKPAAPKRGKARCVTPPFKMRTKRGVRCACGVRNKKGTRVPRFLPMTDARCSGSLPGPMTWKTFTGKTGGGVKTAPMVKVSGIGRRKRRRSTRRRRRY